MCGNLLMHSFCITFALSDFYLLKAVLTTKPMKISQWTNAICTRITRKSVDAEWWGEGKLRLLVLLTGQLEEFQLLSGLNFPDRVGMQQAERTFWGWRMSALKFATKLIWLFCSFCCLHTFYHKIIQNELQKLTDRNGKCINNWFGSSRHTPLDLWWLYSVGMTFFFFVSSFDSSQACYLYSQSVTGK